MFSLNVLIDIWSKVVCYLIILFLLNCWIIMIFFYHIAFLVRIASYERWIIDRANMKYAMYKVNNLLKALFPRIQHIWHYIISEKTFSNYHSKNRMYDSSCRWSPDYRIILARIIRMHVWLDIISKNRIHWIVCKNRTLYQI